MRALLALFLLAGCAQAEPVGVHVEAHGGRASPDASTGGSTPPPISRPGEYHATALPAYQPGEVLDCRVQVMCGAGSRPEQCGTFLHTDGPMEPTGHQVHGVVATMQNTLDGSHSAILYVARHDPPPPGEPDGPGSEGQGLVRVIRHPGQAPRVEVYAPGGFYVNGVRMDTGGSP